MNITLTAFSLLLCLVLGRIARSKWLRNSGTRPTVLAGPPRGKGSMAEYMFGSIPVLARAPDPTLLWRDWMTTYGPAFVIPGPLGSHRLVICDPKAVAHFYARETWGYIQTGFAKVFIAMLFGRGLLWAEGESHRRQRKALTPAFSNAQIRRLTSVFYDSAYKLKAHWDAQIDSGSAEIDVQIWMNRVALDSIGIAGFGHDFGTLDGQTSVVMNLFNSLGGSENALFSTIPFLLAPIFPPMAKIPTKRTTLMKKVREGLVKIADELLERTRNAELSGSEEKSIIGLLLKAEVSTASALRMSQEEILAQMNVLLLAGYETTSISLTWALIELCRKPDVQAKLRAELLNYSSSEDPSYDALSSVTTLPYLDAVVHEVLRLHPPLANTVRTAAEDDVIPFLHPVRTKSGEAVHSVVVPKGSVVLAPIAWTNQCETFWGPRASEFVPERWLVGERVANEGGLAVAKDIQAYRHILTFSDGPRTCLGKAFALAEFKAVLGVLIRHYTFEFPDGPDTVIEKYTAVLPRPKVAGKTGPEVPLLVKRVE